MSVGAFVLFWGAVPVFDRCRWSSKSLSVLVPSCTSQCNLVSAVRQRQAAGYNCWRMCCLSSDWWENPLRNENIPPELSLPLPVSPGIHLGCARDAGHCWCAALSSAATDWEGIQFRLQMCSWRMSLLKQIFVEKTFQSVLFVAKIWGCFHDTGTRLCSSHD